MGPKIYCTVFIVLMSVFVCPRTGVCKTLLGTFLDGALGQLFGTVGVDGVQLVRRRDSWVGHRWDTVGIFFWPELEPLSLSLFYPITTSSSQFFPQLGNVFFSF